MKAKKSANFGGVSLHIGYALGVAEVVYANNGAQLVVTSLRDGKHGDGSLHYSGNAADLRTRGLLPDALNRIVKALQRYLEPAGFDVVLEPTHIHVEYQPKAGERFYTVAE